MPTLLDASLIADTLVSLPGWEGDTSGLWREVHLSPEQNAELRRQVQVDADSMNHHPEVSDVQGGTRFELRTHSAGGVTELDIAMASHISDLVHRLSAEEPGIEAERHGAAMLTVRARDEGFEDGIATNFDEEVMVGASSARETPITPVPDTAPHEPEPGLLPEQENP